MLFILCRHGAMEYTRVWSIELWPTQNWRGSLWRISFALLMIQWLRVAVQSRRCTGILALGNIDNKFERMFTTWATKLAYQSFSYAEAQRSVHEYIYHEFNISILHRNLTKKDNNKRLRPIKFGLYNCFQLNLKKKR